MAPPLAEETNEKDGPGPSGSDIRPVSIADEMRRSYLDYAMSVIVSRALPDVRDGLKPVHRRILYSMNENGHTPDKAHVKSARIVGDVMGKYHPHGDAAIYDALVRMAQPFSMSLMLIDGQGNFGSVDNDPPAAMRYTESRLAKPALALLEDIDEGTVDFQPNYDDKEHEPTVLPARFPNLLVNGAGGIAVGMATNIPPHNLGEVIDAAIAMIDRPDMTVAELMEIVPGPDFPTAATILGRGGIRNAYSTGRGSIIMRASARIETTRKDRETIIISEIPYQVNKAALVERIADLVREKKIEGISDLRDESDRDGMRIVIELRREAVADVVLNQLWRHTSLQSSFPVNMIALNGKRPEMMTLRDVLRAFVDFRETVVTRRTKFRLGKARDSAHLQVGLAIAVANIDEVIHLIRSSPDAAAARKSLMARAWPAKDMAPLVALIADPRHALGEDGTCRLSEAQARGILDLRLQRLTALGREEISAALHKLSVEIAEYLEILGSREKLFGIIKDEMLEVKRLYATPRRTQILDAESDVEDEDSDRPRGHGRHRLARRLHQARAALDLSRAAARRQGPLRHADEGGGFRPPPLRRQHPYAGAVFSSLGRAYKEKVWRLPLARAAGSRQGARQHAAARPRRAHHDDHAAARGRSELGDARRDLRDDARHGAAQQAVGFLRCAT